MKVIPAIDLLDGKVVRLEKGDYDKETVYNDDPVAEARTFRSAGFNHLHVIDLNGAREGSFINLGSIQQIIDDTGLSVQSGGGIRKEADALKLLGSGISKVICTSMAVRSPDDWLRLLERHADRVILGMDLKEGKIAYSGWTKTLDEPVESFLEPMLERGLQEILCTDVERDGMLSGPNVALYRNLMEQFPAINFIASGGVSGKKDLIDLQNIGIHAAVVGRAYYEGNITLDEMRELSS